MKTQFPELKGNEVIKAIGAKWTTLTDSEKQPYVEMAKQDKIRADNELSALKKKGDLMVTNKQEKDE